MPLPHARWLGAAASPTRWVGAAVATHRRLSSASPGHWRAALHRASGMASTTTGRVLASMRPYTVVAAISRVGGRSYGLALSDPYLSHAAPLSTVRGPGDAVLCASMWDSPGWQCHSSLAAPPVSSQRPGAVGRAAVKDLGTRRQSPVPRGHAEITPSSRGGHAKVTPSPLSPRRSTCRHALRRALQDSPVGALLLAGPLQRRDPISRLYLASISTVSPLYLPYISPDHSSGATLA